MALSADLLRRMGGELDVVSTLGQGTRTSITLPVSFTSPSSPGPLPASFLRTRCISDELAHLLGDGGPLSSPALEHAGFDFSQAVNAAQSTLAGTGGGGIALKPSLRRKRSAFATSPHRTATMEVADDLIKLSLTTGSPTAPAFNRAAPPRLPAGACRLASLLPPSRFPTPLVTPSRTTTANLVHVLVADDNPIARNILTKLFSGKVSSLPGRRPPSSVLGFADSRRLRAGYRLSASFGRSKVGGSVHCQQGRDQPRPRRRAK